MPPEARELLHDIDAAAGEIAAMLAGKGLTHFTAERALRLSVERLLITIGEAVAQLSKHHPSVADRLSHRREIIAFRNILVHGYAVIGVERVWEIAEGDLGNLRREIAALLASP